MSKQIRIRVSPEGETTVKTEGYSGTECLEASKPFERLGRVTSDEITTEMYSIGTQILGELVYGEEED